jgi:tRNA (guanine-N7-)-methyltransferase
MNANDPVPVLAEGDGLLSKTYDVVLAHRRAELGVQLAKILSNSDSFVWEVGCGHGHFLAAYAAAHHDQICIGIDIAGDRIERARRKRDRAKLENLHFIRAEARLFLETIPANRSIRDIFILFPDPWPKLRHHKHRILQPEFLAQLTGKVEEGGRLFFRTDHRSYFEEACAVLRNNSRWNPPTEDAWSFEHETVFQNRAETFSSLTARLRDSGDRNLSFGI